MRRSHSEVACYLECPQKWMHNWLRRMSTKKVATYFLIGRAIHAFLEHFYKFKGENLEHGIKQALKEFEKTNTSLMTQDEIHSMNVDKAMVEGICHAYPKFYQSDFDKYEEFLLENHAEITLPGGERYHGYIDVLAKDAAGDWWVIETKTKRLEKDLSSYFERVRIDSQVLGYMHLAKEILGQFPAGVVYNAVQKTAIRLRSGENIKAFTTRVRQEYDKYAKTKSYFQREEIRVGPKPLKIWMRNMDAVTLQMKQIQQNKGPFVMNTGSCFSFMSNCVFLPACIDRKYSKLLYQKRER